MFASAPRSAHRWLLAALALSLAPACTASTGSTAPVTPLPTPEPGICLRSCEEPSKEGEDAKEAKWEVDKPPGVDGRHPLHQDLRYFALRPADRIVASWTAIDRATRENGCLAVVPGSHRGSLLPHRDPDWERVNTGFFAIDDFDPEARVHVAMEPGDTLLFHPLLIHGSGPGASGWRATVSLPRASSLRSTEAADGDGSL